MGTKRMKRTAVEKAALSAAGDGEMSTVMSDEKVQAELLKEQEQKLKDEYTKYEDALKENDANVKKTQESLDYDINKAELLPLFSRIIVKQLEHNPFQREVYDQSGILNGIGSSNLNVSRNPMTGKYEKEKEFIVTGVVQEVGPEVKYIQRGDVIYYRVDTCVPVPFFSSGFKSIAENQIIAVVNEGLTERFKEVMKNGGRE